MTEQFSRTEKASSYVWNYSELLNGLLELEANPCAIGLYIVIEAEQTS